MLNLSSMLWSKRHDLLIFFSVPCTRSMIDDPTYTPANMLYLSLIRSQGLAMEILLTYSNLNRLTAWSDFEILHIWQVICRPPLVWWNDLFKIPRWSDRNESTIYNPPLTWYVLLSCAMVLTDRLRSPPSIARVLVHNWILSIHPPFRGQAHYLIGK